MTTTRGGLLAVREVRLVVGASLLSVLGDQVARVALAVTVYDRTGSALLSAASWALTMLPWVLGGPVLTAYADLLPRRRVLVGCDLVRAAVLLLLAVPGVPLLAVVLVLALAELLAPPASAAGTALLFDVLDEDQATSGAAITSTVHELGQVGGFLVGGVLVASVGASGAFLLDALTFLLSAALLARLPARPAAVAQEDRTGVLEEVRAGWRALSGQPRVRALVLLAWAGCAVSVVPEGLAAPYAAAVGGGATATGWLLAAVPAGVVVGNLAVARLGGGDRAAVALALGVGLALLPSALAPGVLATVLLWFACGCCAAFLSLAQAGVATATPPALRGRVFGLAGTGLQLCQGAAVLLAGVASSAWGAPAAVAVGGAVGLLLVGAAGASLLQPGRSPERRPEAVAVSW